MANPCTGGCGRILLEKIMCYDCIQKQLENNKENEGDLEDTLKQRGLKKGEGAHG